MRAVTPEQKRRKKWLWGCTGGCLGFIVVVVVLMFVGGRLLKRMLERPQPMVSPELLVTAETDAFVFATVQPDDPLMLGTTVRLLMLPTIRDRAPTPEGRQLSMDADTMRVNLRQVAPIQGVVLFERLGEPERTGKGLIVSVHRYAPLLALLVRGVIKAQEDEGSSSEYKEATLLIKEDGTAVAVRDNNLMLADREDLVRAWVDSLELHTPSEEGAPFEPPRAELQAGPLMKSAHELLGRTAPIRFACGNAHGELLALMAVIPEDQGRAELAATGLASPEVLCLSGQFESLNNLDAILTLFLTCADSGSAGQLQERLRQFADAAGDSAPLKEVAMAQVSDAVLRIEARVPNLPDKVIWLAERVAALKEKPAAGQGDEGEEPAPTPPLPSQ